RLGRYSDALADFDALLARIPHHVEALFNRGTALLEIERPEPALAAFDAAGAAPPPPAGARGQPGGAPPGPQPAAPAVTSVRKGDRPRQKLRRCTFEHGALAAHTRAIVARLCRI